MAALVQWSEIRYIVAASILQADLMVDLKILRQEFAASRAAPRVEGSDLLGDKRCYALPFDGHATRVVPRDSTRWRPLRCWVARRVIVFVAVFPAVLAQRRHGTVKGLPRREV